MTDCTEMLSPFDKRDFVKNEPRLRKLAALFIKQTDSRQPRANVSHQELCMVIVDMKGKNLKWETMKGRMGEGRSQMLAAVNLQIFSSILSPIAVATILVKSCLYY